MSTITKKSMEERLEVLIQKLKEAQKKEPQGFNAQIADLSYKILRMKKSMRILVSTEQDQLIGLMLEHAYHMKTGERDRYVARKAFERVLQLDRENPEANYRYAFIHYEDENWITAINHFKRAIQDNDSEFPLSKDQIIKGNLFIGYCSVMLAKESMEIAEGLSLESEELIAEGISIDKLSKRLKSMLESTEFILYRNNEEILISKEEYEEFVFENYDNSLLINLAEGEPYIKSREEKSVSRYNAILLKKLLLKNSNDEALSLADISGYQEESVSDAIEINWDNYRQMIRRTNQKLAEIGLPEKLIKHIPSTRSYKIEDINYTILQYDAQ